LLFNHVLNGFSLNPPPLVSITRGRQQRLLIDAPAKTLVFMRIFLPLATLFFLTVAQLTL